MKKLWEVFKTFYIIVMIKNYTIAMTCKANILKEESHMLHIPLGGWSKDKSTNRLALILPFTTTYDSALFKTVAEKRYSIRKNTTVSEESNKLIAKQQKMTSDYETFLCLIR